MEKTGENRERYREIKRERGRREKERETEGERQREGERRWQRVQKRDYLPERIARSRSQSWGLPFTGSHARVF